MEELKNNLQNVKNSLQEEQYKHSDMRILISKYRNERDKVSTEPGYPGLYLNIYFLI